MKKFIDDKSLFILIDPEKESNHKLWLEKATRINDNANISGILIGGSTLKKDYGTEIISTFKKLGPKTVIGFPGSLDQIYDGLDAVLFLNYLNSDEETFTRLDPILAARDIDKKKISSIPCAYIIINEKSESTTLKVTNSKAFHPAKDVESIFNRISYAWHSGQKHLYLEAGSGTDRNMDIDLLKKIRVRFDFHIIVGGGIQTKKEVEAYHNAGANTVVIGTAVEQNPNLLAEL